jgi:RNA polymerase-interacting CarD/CdnL/TRCF family regulator
VFHESRRCYDDDSSKEVKRVQKRIRGFNWRKSTAWWRLWVSYGPKLKHSELISIADLVATKFTIRLDRDARGRKVVEAV